ncbi:MAG: CHASE domain-containing protein [Verrucomicrobiia bacterium]
MPPQASAQVFGRRTWVPALVLITLLLLSGIATYSAARLFHGRDKLQFTNGVRQVTDSVERRLGIYTDILVVGSALYGANREVTEEEFREYVRRLRVSERYPGIQGVGFSIRVLPGEREELIARMRSEGFPEFRIWPDPGDAECQSIIYLEPMDERNERAIGYDMSSEPVRKAAMDRARDHAKPAVSARVTLVQETAGSQVQPGFLIYVPVYRTRDVPDTVEGRRQELAGFVYSPFRAHDLFRGIFPNQATAPVDFRVFDEASSSPDHLLFETPRSDPTRRLRFTHRSTMNVAGTSWTVEFASGAFLESTSGTVLVPFLGLSGLLVSLLAFRLTSGQAAAYAALEKSTEALKASQADLAASEELHRMVTDGAADSIISIDDQGLIQSVNPATVQSFGYQASELGGKSLKALIPDFSIGSHLPLGPEEARQDIELAAVNLSGQHIPVEISFSRFLRRGQTFYTAVLRDITQRKEAEAIQKRQAQLTALRADVSTALARSGDSIAEVLQHCADALAENLDAAFAGVWALDGSEKQLDLRASAGPDASDELLSSRAVAAWPLVKRIASERRPLLLNENAGSPPAFGELAGSNRLVSFAGCPLSVEGQLIGVVAFFARQPLDDDTLGVLSSTADLIAQGIERKRIERTLEESEDRLRIAVESAEAGTWELNPATGKLVCSARTKALFGLASDSELGYEGFFERISPEDTPGVRRAIDAALNPQGDGRYEIDFRSLWPDGGFRWISAKGRAFFEENDGVRRAVRFTGTVFDVTRRRHAEERTRFLAEAGSALSESPDYENTLAKLARLAVPRVADWCAVDMVVSGNRLQRLELIHADPAKTQWAKGMPNSHPLDLKGGLSIAGAIRNGSAELLTTVPDLRVLSLSPGEDQQKLVRELGARSAVIVPIKARGRVFGAVTFVFGDSKRTYTVEDLSLAKGLGERAGLAVDNALLYRAAQQEIAERRRVEEQIHQLNQELEERVRRRTQALEESNQHLEAFTYTVAHDLRAPLRAMQGFSQALIEDYAGRLDATGRDYVLRITNAAQRMDGLIQDLLAYSRLSRTQLKTEAVDLELVLDRVLMTFASEIRGKHALIEVGRPLPAVWAHPSTLEHVLANLVSNALKFVNPGTAPRVRILAEERGGAVCLSVIDQGIGVDPQYHERIFGVFERLHGPETFPGTGIGLAIVRKGVERMGGRVGVESQPGHGSKFWVKLRAPQNPG